MRALFAASEALPFVKTGGLADVAGILPRYISKLGNEVFVALPFYRSLIKKNTDLGVFKRVQEYHLNIEFGDGLYEIKIYHVKDDDLNYLLFVNDDIFEKDSLYVKKQINDGIELTVDQEDNFETYAIFSKAVVELIIKNKMDIDVIHTHDWQTAMIPVYMKSDLYSQHFQKMPLNVFTIHNIAFQGVFPFSKWQKTGLDDSYFTLDKMEYWGDINLMKGGIIYSDVITTVSKKYANEIQTSEFGAGLEGLLSLNHNKLYGIVNGIDSIEWDPQNDVFIKPHNYDNTNIENKYVFKEEFLKKYGFADPALPLFTMVTRLTQQKGIDLLMEIMERFLNLPVNLFILGSGDSIYEDKFKKCMLRFPDKFRFETGFRNELAHCLYAAGDYFLMPSVFEPCGLGQMIAMRYGNIPIARRTGGLADTLRDVNDDQQKANAFLFNRIDPSELLEIILRALRYNNNRDLINNAMHCDLSWERSAKEYIKIYTEG